MFSVLFLCYTRWINSMFYANNGSKIKANTDVKKP